MSAAAYPPEDHLLRDLDFQVTVESSDRCVARLGAGGPGAGGLGRMLAVADLLAGTVCLDAVAPDWMATSVLAFHLAGPVPHGPAELAATLLRAGRTTIAVEVRACTTAGQLVGEGVVSFTRLAGGTGRPTFLAGDRAPGRSFSFPAAGAARTGSLAAAIGCEVLDPATGHTETPVTGYVRNSFGAVNGGVVAAVAVESAGACLRGWAPDLVVQDIVIHYLAQGRVGPVATSARVVRAGDDGAASCAVRVDLIDEGADRPMAIAHLTMACVPPAT
jgi:acyl-coenzyme A thioesterase PaaI-like protein